MELTIEKGVAMPASTRGTGVNYINTFKSTIKPTLDKMDEVGQSFFYPTDKPEKSRRDLLWVANKYGMLTGKKFAAIAIEHKKADENGPEVKGGVRFFLAEDGLEPTTPELSVRQKEIVGDALNTGKQQKVEEKPAPEVNTK